MKRLALLAWYCLFLTPLGAQESVPANAKSIGPKTIVVEITPRAIENPVLKYRFLPREDELKPGNAVPILLRLIYDQGAWMANVYPNLQKWEDVHLGDPKWIDYRDIPPHFFMEMRRAAYRREADWEYPIGESPAMTIRVPDIHNLRVILGYGLSSRAKYHLSRGELENALEVIKVGMANGRHLANTPFVINQFVASVIQRLMLDRTVDLVSRPGCPNLYWGLSAIPKGILSLERAADLEGQMLALTFPVVQELDKPRTKEEWKNLLDQQLKRLAQISGLVMPKDELKQKAVLFGVEVMARKELPELLGCPAERVAEMGMEEVVLRWFVANQVQLGARYNAYSILPSREALPLLIQLDRDFDRFYKRLNFQFFEIIKNPLLTYLSLHANFRRIQMIRVIESVRHYAALHGGKLPEKLEDITDIPVPLDPLTDKPFVWKLELGHALLSSPDLPPDVVTTIKEKKYFYLGESLGTTYHLKLRTK